MTTFGNNTLEVLAGILSTGLTIYMWIVVIRALISWVNPNPNNPVVQFLASVTDPVLFRIRRRLPVFFGGIDLSPLILILLIVFLNNFVVLSLKMMARGASAGVILPLLIVSLINLVRTGMVIYMIVLIARAVISWISPDPYNPIVVLIHGITEPLLSRLRRTFPLVYSGIDLSPLIIIAGIFLVMRVLDRLEISVRGLV